MRPRPIRRRLLLLLLRQPKKPQKNQSLRTFTHNSCPLSGSRPQLPFLSIPCGARFQRQQWRYLTTERKSWLKSEVATSVKYTAYIWAIVVCLATAGFAIQQEFMEHKFPTPAEWSFRTRMLKRGAEAEKARPDVVMENWPLIIQMLQDVVDRLEDPRRDGQGLRDLGSDAPPGAKDISAKSEPWRRGYYEALMLWCLAAEHVEGWVLDTTRKTVFPADVVKGPSNPFPKPVPPGAKAPPREEDCVSAGFPNPDECYLKLIATQGLTNKQRMDAALAYANWLEYKGAVAPAGIMYEEALSMAIDEIHTPGSPALLDPKTAVLNNENADRKPSANLFKTLTALATFKARNDDVSTALPILISILQARRSLPGKLPPGINDDDFMLYSPPKSITQKVLDVLRPPSYPPPPPDGTQPPVRDSTELCEEAALHLHIGEIMYTMQPSLAATREDGLAWTREGVDMAEEQLHRVLDADRDNRDAKTTCRACLAAGLDNWRAMVRRMVSEEEQAQASGEKAAGWFGLWSGGAKTPAAEEEEAGGRWAAEEKVLTDRTRRAQEILEDLEKPNAGLMSGLFKT